MRVPAGDPLGGIGDIAVGVAVGLAVGGDDRRIDPRIAGHVAGEIIGIGAILAFLPGIVGSGELTEIIVAVGLVLGVGGDRAVGDAQHPP